MSDVSMEVNLGGLIMRNPVTDASGTFAAGREYNDFTDVSRMGAVTTKGVSLNGWPGNPAPRIAETPSGMLNSIGLQNPGVQVMIQKDLEWLAGIDVPVIVNVSGHSVEEYAQVIEALDNQPTVSAYEVNISCPNVDAGGMTFGTDPHMAQTVVSACRQKTRKPLIVKLTPNVTDVTEIARAAVEGGADAVSLINTLLGMRIDPVRRRPVIANTMGGFSGPAIFPVAVRMVYQVSRACRIPVIGCGGVATARDVIEMMMAGATAVEVGAANLVNPYASKEIVEALPAEMERLGIGRLRDIVGCVE